MDQQKDSSFWDNVGLHSGPILVVGMILMGFLRAFDGTHKQPPLQPAPVINPGVPPKIPTPEQLQPLRNFIEAAQQKQHQEIRVERVAKEQGAASLACYQQVCAVMERWRENMAQAKQLGEENEPDVDWKTRFEHFALAHDQAAKQMKELDTKDVDQRTLFLTEELRKYLDSQQSLLAKIASRAPQLQPEHKASLENLVTTLEKIWEPSGSFKRAYEKWLMDRYGIDAAADEPKEPPTP